MSADAADEFARLDRQTAAAHARVRLANLASFGPRLTRSDRYDIAFAIWDDFIRDNRHDEIDLTAALAEQQAQVFVHVLDHLPAAEVVDLAIAAWGTHPIYCAIASRIPGEAAGWFTWSPSQERVHTDIYPTAPMFFGRSLDIRRDGAVLGLSALTGVHEPHTVDIVSGILGGTR